MARNQKRIGWESEQTVCSRMNVGVCSTAAVELLGRGLMAMNSKHEFGLKRCEETAGYEGRFAGNSNDIGGSGLPCLTGEPCAIRGTPPCPLLRVERGKSSVALRANLRLAGTSRESWYVGHSFVYDGSVQFSPVPPSSSGLSTLCLVMAVVCERLESRRRDK